MGKENMVHIENEEFSAVKKNEVGSFERDWM